MSSKPSTHFPLIAAHTALAVAFGPSFVEVMAPELDPGAAHVVDAHFLILLLANRAPVDGRIWECHNPDYDFHEPSVGCAIHWSPGS